MRVLFLAACLAIAAVISATIVFAVASFAAHSDAHVCQVGTEDEFYAHASDKNAKMMVANDAAREKVFRELNARRAKEGLFALEADKLVVGLFSENGMLFVGVVAFKDKCVVPGTVAVLQPQHWVAFLLEIGASADDFVEMRNG